jgi:hypothetical protein
MRNPCTAGNGNSLVRIDHSHSRITGTQKSIPGHKSSSGRSLLAFTNRTPYHRVNARTHEYVLF